MNVVVCRLKCVRARARVTTAIVVVTAAALSMNADKADVKGAVG